MFYVIRVRVFLVLFVVFRVFTLLYCGGLIVQWCGGFIFDNIFIFDGLSFYTILLVRFLGVYCIMCFLSHLSIETRFYLFLSLLFSALCFCTNHSVLFWCFYELAMLPLIYLIFKESPYSERFLAGWYFCSYLLVTRLPLILILIYISRVQNTFLITEWEVDSRVSYLIFVVLSFVFLTKVPLTPFHTWLPIVHAEATSIVSIFLRGYIMKLGLLGIFRCTRVIFKDGLFVYMFMCCFACFYYFFASIGELDGKRWLAFLSLAHITVPFLAFFIAEGSDIMFMFLYCLGHGLGAGIVFGLLWLFYDICNRRNWFVIKSSTCNGKLLMTLSIFCLLVLCSFPTTINFFSEVGLVKDSLFMYILIIFWAGYLFFGGLIPSIVCGHFLLRCEFVDSGMSGHYCYLICLFYLCSWCYVGFLFL